MTSNGSSAAIDLSTWLTVREAAERLQKSERTILRLIQRAELQALQRPRKGAKPETVVNPEDIEFQLPQPHILPPEKASIAATREELGALARLAQLLGPQPPPSSPPRYPLWLSLQQACEYSGLGPSQIERLIGSGILVVMRRPLRIQRASLDSHANAEALIEP